MKFDVSDIKIDDDLVVSGKTVRIGSSGNVKFQTPVKPSIKSSKNICSIHEMYRSIKPDILNKCLDSQEYDAKYCKSTERMRDKNALNIFSLAYNSKESIPDDEQIRMMADLQYVNTDVIVTPSWYDLIKRNDKVDTDLYLRLSKAYHEYASFKNHKPIMATIPACIPSSEISTTVKHFLDLNVTSFMIDFNGRSMTNGTWLRGFIREWDSYNIEKEGILYSMNAFQGIDKRNEGRVEAKDFLGFATGMDIIGDKHIAKGSSDIYAEKEIHAKVFNRSTYMYDKILCRKKDMDDLKIDSIQNQIDEMQKLRNAIDERESIRKILESKSIEEATMRHLVNLKHDVKIYSTKLSDFFD